MSDATPGPDFERAFHRVAERHERIWIFWSFVVLALLTLGTMFLVVADYGVVTKGVSFATDPRATAASPAFRTGGVVRTGPNRYDAYVTGHVWAWQPGTLHVPEGATVTFHVTSADVLHGFEVQGTPINLTAVPGIVGSVTYVFRRTGIFHIICNEYCGMMHHAMIGRIIVDPPNGTRA